MFSDSDNEGCIPIIDISSSPDVTLSEPYINAASHHCSILGVPSVIDILISFASVQEPEYVGLVIMPKTYHGTSLYCSVVSQNLHGSLGVMTGVVFPTLREERVLVISRCVKEFSLLRHLSQDQIVLDDNDIQILGVMQTCSGELKYGLLDINNHTQVNTSVLEVGEEIKITLDQSSHDAETMNVISLTILAFPDKTWHPVEVSVATVPCVSSDAENQACPVVACFKVDILWRYLRYSLRMNESAAVQYGRLQGKKVLSPPSLVGRYVSVTYVHNHRGVL